MQNAPISPSQPEKTSSPYTKPLLIAIALLTIGVGLFVWQPFSKKTEPAPFQRDEKTQDQILQDDYRDKVIDMLEDGMSVAEISKQTGLRKDLIRKIKKEYEEETE